MLNRSYCVLLSLLLWIGGVAYAEDAEEPREKSDEVNCTIVLAKSSCWQDRELTLRVIDALTFERKQTIKLPLNQPYVTRDMMCGRYDQLTFQVNFRPAVWEGQEDRWYQAKQIWNVPTDLEDDEAWIVQLCFPDDFMRVPMLPLGDLSDCWCEFPESD